MALSGRPRVTRFSGDPASVEQPDVGDVLAACSTRTGMVTGTRYVIVAARPTRGHQDDPSKLTLTLVRDDTAEPSSDARLIPFHWTRR